MTKRSIIYKFKNAAYQWYILRCITYYLVHVGVLEGWANFVGL
jgi:hypothetical protein